MRSERLTETELVLPSLYLMSINPTGSISTTELIRLLTQIMNPQGLDAQMLNNRSDTYFSQKVRNLKSHDTLTKNGYAVYSDGSYHITDQGRQLVLSNKSIIQYILSSGFIAIKSTSRLSTLPMETSYPLRSSSKYTTFSNAWPLSRFLKPSR